MKLIIQIPCLNEEETLPQTLADLPRNIEGIDEIEYLIIDDGSTDRTTTIARECGVHHIVWHRQNKGLAAAFATGIDACLKLGADIIVNTDADNQYQGQCIVDLVMPILEGRAEIVIGDRGTAEIEHFSWIKRKFQKLGTSVVETMAQTKIGDAVSGFRAFSSEAALKINIVSTYSYTVETVIQAGQRRIAMTSVPIGTNKVERPSRLVKSMTSFISQQSVTILRMYAMYRPLRTFAWIGFSFIIIGLIPFVRFIYYYFAEGGAGHIQSLLFGAVMIIIGILACMMAILADLVGRNRQLIEQILENVRRRSLSNDKGDE